MNAEEYTIANFGFDGSEQVLGQSFTPSDVGPEGSGSPSSSMVKLKSFSIGYPTYGIEGRCKTCYIYDIPLTEPAQIGQDEGLVATTLETYDEEDVLGPGSYSRKFIINSSTSQPLAVNTKYYAYFSEFQRLCTVGGSVYGGGNLYDYACEPLVAYNLQFEAVLESIH